jgi:GTPase SAR1 family protein
MLEFVTLLRQRYQAVLLQLSDNSALAATFRQRIEQLTFTEAFIRKGQLLETRSKPPLQIVIIGPTQTGKSSVTNVLLESDSAGVSPLAGYTVHPQGFCVEVSLAACQSLQHYFGRYQQLSPEKLSKHRYDCYALAESPAPSPLLPPCVFWDTPDFDSIDSDDYKEGVIRTIALADIVVLVVSKEKYADQSVWEMMSTIEAFKQPTLICLNKLSVGNEETILQSLKEKWAAARGDAFPTVVPLLYEKETGIPLWSAQYSGVFFQLAHLVDHRKQKQLQQAFINQYWQSWIEPILKEHQAEKDWQILVDLCIEQAVCEYQRDYLNHPRHYDTFQKTIIELLVLLEIPGFAKVLSKIRRALTWPMRQVAQMGKPKQPEMYATQELSLLNQIGEHLLIQIAEQLLEKNATDREQQLWWQSLYRLLREQRRLILQDFNHAALEYHLNFQQDVQNSAQQLYHKLQQQPLLLNTIRATRLTTDAVLMALVIHTGGIGVSDLFLTPAMLSITSLLTESAIGSYMNKVEAQLKQQQLFAVKKQLFTQIMQQVFFQLPDLLTEQNRFAISPQQLQEVQQQPRADKRYGLHLF